MPESEVGEQVPGGVMSSMTCKKAEEHEEHRKFIPVLVLQGRYPKSTHIGLSLYNISLGVIDPLYNWVGVWRLSATLRMRGARCIGSKVKGHITSDAHQTRKLLVLAESRNTV